MIEVEIKTWDSNKNAKSEDSIFNYTDIESLKCGEQNRLDTWLVHTLNTECLIKIKFNLIESIPPP